MSRTVLFGITVAVAAGAVGLGVWQLRRLESRRSVNREAALARGLAPIAIPHPSPSAGPAERTSSNRRARLTGRFDESREFVLRGRVVRGVPAVQIITPLRISGWDSAILVNRGYVPAPDAATPGAVTWSEPGDVEVQGVLLPVPDRGDGAPLVRGRGETWKTLDLTAMRQRLPYPTSALYLVAGAPESGTAHTVRGTVYPFRAEPPELGDGPHLMYAIQWFGIAVAVLAFGVFFVLRRPAPRID